MGRAFLGNLISDRFDLLNACSVSLSPCTPTNGQHFHYLLSSLQLLNSQSRFVRYDMVTEIVSLSSFSFVTRNSCWFLFLTLTLTPNSLHFCIFFPCESRRALPTRETDFSSSFLTCWCVPQVEGRAPVSNVALYST